MADDELIKAHDLVPSSSGELSFIFKLASELQPKVPVL